MAGSLTELIVQLGIKIDNKELEKVKRVAVGFDTIKDAAEGLGKVFTGGRGIKDFFMTSISKATELQKLSAVMGMSTDTIQKWQYAATKAGISEDEVVSGLQELQHQGYRSDKSVLRLASSFQKMSAGERDLQGKLRGLSKEFTYFLSKGPEYIQQAFNMAEATNAIISPEELEKADKTRESIESIAKSFEKMAQTIADKAAPALQTLFDGITSFVKEFPEFTIYSITAALGVMTGSAIIGGITTLIMKLKAIAEMFGLISKTAPAAAAGVAEVSAASTGGTAAKVGAGAVLGKVGAAGAVAYASYEAVKNAGYALVNALNGDWDKSLPVEEAMGKLIHPMLEAMGVKRGFAISAPKANVTPEAAIPQNQGPITTSGAPVFNNPVFNILSTGPIQDAINGVTGMIPGVEPRINQYPFGATNMTGGQY